MITKNVLKICEQHCHFMVNHAYTQSRKKMGSKIFFFFFLYNLGGSTIRLFLYHCTTFSIFFLFFPGYIILFHKKKYISRLFVFFFLYFFSSPTNKYILHYTYIYVSRDFSDVCGLLYVYIERSWPRNSNQSKKKLVCHTARCQFTI